MKGKGKKLCEYLSERKPQSELLELRFEEGGGFSITPLDLFSLRNQAIMSREIVSTEEKAIGQSKKIVIVLKGEW